MVDAYVLRSMHRRCNYDIGVVQHAALCIAMEQAQRTQGTSTQGDTYLSKKIGYYIEQYQRSSVADVVILPYLDQTNVSCLSDDHLAALLQIINGMLQHKPFELITIHDEFKALCGNINQVRFHYKEILAELAESNLLDDLLSQIHGMPGSFNKRSFNLGDQIRQSNYALC